MDAALKRPWYRLHWGTWLVGMLVAAAIAWTHYRWSPNIVGWPLVCMRPFQVRGVPSWVFLTNYLSVCVVLFSTTCVVEAAIRRGRWQFSIRGLLMATFTVAVLLALWQAPAALVYLPVLGDLAPEVGFEFDPLLRFHAMANWVVRLPIMFGVGCTVYLPVRVALQALTWYLSLFRRSPTRDG